MCSKNEKGWRSYWRRFSRLRISTKITMTYALILAVVLVLTSMTTGLGVYFSFYHQAEREIQICIQYVLEKLEEKRGSDISVWTEAPVFPGVVLRITEPDGKVVYETEERYPPVATIESYEIADPPFWANKEMRVAEIDNFAVYHAKVDISYESRPYELHFFRTITAEKHFLATLQNLLFVTTLLGFAVALLAGYLLSRRILKPISSMTKTVQQIEIEELGYRLQVPETRDELAELATTFNHMLDRLEAGFEQQQRFVSNASHELRTPVTVILGYADLLSRWGRDDAEVLDEGISSIRSEAENMQQLIEKLLFLARADQKRQVLHKEELDFAELLADVMKKTELVTDKHTVTLTENAPGTVLADEVTLRQMLRIFLENSVKYTPAGGHITAGSRLSEDGKALLVTLSDDGIGIPGADQAKVFERFYRVDASRTKGAADAGGTGLGLSIARWIAEQHGIGIRLESELDQGTSIYLSIPLVKTGN